jgi:hypothetical protein
MLVIASLDRQAHAKVLELDAVKAAGLQGMTGVNMTPAEKENYAKAAVDRYQACTLPWFGDPGQQTKGVSYLEDRLAQWVAVFGKDIEMLKQISGTRGELSAAAKALVHG